MSIKAEDNITLESKKPIYDIASNTEQHFWFEGTDPDETGAHITEVPQEEWEDSTSPNYHKGGNLLARSNGIAVRDGLTELARFGANGMQMGKEDEQHILITPNELGIYDAGGGLPFFVQTGATVTTEDTVAGAIVNANASMTSQLVLKGDVVNGRFYVEVGDTPPLSYTRYIDNPSTSGSSITIDGVTITLTKKSDHTIKADRVNSNVSQKYVYIKYTQSYYPTNTIINQRSMTPTYQRLYLEDTDGTCSMAYAYIYGSIAMVRLRVYKSGITSTKGSVVYRGNLINLIPIMGTSLHGFITDKGVIYGVMNESGLVDVRNFTGQAIDISSSNPLDLYGIYILKEGSV